KDRKIAVSGWTETSETDLFDFLAGYINKGITKTICTDISKDGMLEGPSLELYKEILNEFPDLYLIASGGVSSMSDIDALQQAGVPAVIFGKAIYEGRIGMEEIKKRQK
ncbi:MAG: phosphoribosylformimino-5-aminoimidazole carboxamide ribotide isomerase, partial [Anaerophaga sp.]|nr:phosphoribosylformimino-5-aminoimidazole carboxamide ribotide isomerase [Anaerophaga sp.]